VGLVVGWADGLAVGDTVGEVVSVWATWRSFEVGSFLFGPRDLVLPVLMFGWADAAVEEKLLTFFDVAGGDPLDRQSVVGASLEPRGGVGDGVQWGGAGWDGSDFGGGSGRSAALHAVPHWVLVGVAEERFVKGRVLCFDKVKIEVRWLEGQEVLTRPLWSSWSEKWGEVREMSVLRTSWRMALRVSVVRLDRLRLLRGSGENMAIFWS